MAATTPDHLVARKRNAAPTAQEMPGAVDAVVARWTPTTQALANAVREFVPRIIPTMTERAYAGWGAIGFREPQAGYVMGIFAMDGGIELIFEQGFALADPDGLFADRPRMKQVRVVEVRKPSDINRRALGDMLRRAVLHGSIKQSR